MHHPLVTIMIPTYRQAAYVVRAIESALRQNYPNIEVIVSDDFSPDDTQVIVERFISARKDPRIKYTKNPENLGILRNYYSGLYQKAAGDWVVNLDGDDFFVDNGFISAAMDLSHRNPAVRLIFANYAEHYQASGNQIDIKNKGLPQIMSDEYFFERYASGGVNWNHNSIIYRRVPAMDVGCYWHPTLPRNDWESFLRLIVGSPVGFLPRTVAAWVQHGNNETSRLDLDKYVRNFTLIDEIATFAKQNGMNSAFVASWRRKMQYKSTKSSCIAYLRRSDIRGIAKFLRAAARFYPLAPVRAATDLSLIVRGVLALNPSLYLAAKQLGRKLRS